MIQKTCQKCKKTYSAQGPIELNKHFAFRNIRRNTFVYQCRPCKRLYDRRHHKSGQKAELDKYKEFMRMETRRIVKSEKPCAVTSCSQKAELHHFDYTTPSEVLPVCRKHHVAIHRLNRLLDDYD